MKITAVGAQVPRPLKAEMKRQPPSNEMMLSQDQRMAIPLKLLKVAGIALDPQPGLPNLELQPLSGTRSSAK